MINQRPHKQLKVWQRAIELVTEIYRITDSFPKKEEFGLTAQLRRAAVSVPSNISEGLTRKSGKEKLHFLNIAQSSLSEIDCQVEIGIRLGYLDQETYEQVEKDLVEVQMLLSGLSRSIR